MKPNVIFNTWQCAQQPVFLRADLNVPLKNGTIVSDKRLQAIKPTLDALLNKKAIVILATHLGRPKKQEPSLSTRQLIPWFKKNGYRIIFCKDPDTVQAMLEKNVPPKTILLLENLRFFPGEQTGNYAFAQELKQLANWYVNDAFGALHRNDTSVVLLAEQFHPDKRSLGYLVAKELQFLEKTFSLPTASPLCFILGGGKISDKLPLIDHFIGKADQILLCPALVFTFLKAQGNQVGRSLIDETLIPIAQLILNKADKTKTKLIFPIDYQVALNTIDGPLEFVAADNFPPNGIGISIGSETIIYYKKYIEKAAIIFFNGMMGFNDRPETLHGMEQLLTLIAQAPGTSIVAGGDSLALIEKLKLEGISYQSTGGGSTLTYLAGKKLPGLQPFLSENGAKSN